MNYFRITGYNPTKDFCFIIDSNGMHQKLWELSAMMIQKGLKVLEASKLENVIDINIEPIEEDTKHIFLMASAFGEPKRIKQTLNGTTYKAIQVGNKIYIPDITQTI